MLWGAIGKMVQERKMRWTVQLWLIVFRLFKKYKPEYLVVE